MDKDFLLKLHASGATHRELFLVQERSHLSGKNPQTDINAFAECGIPEDRAFEILKNLRTQCASPSWFSDSGRSVFFNDEEYPKAFSQLKNRPFVLYVKGVFLESFSDSVSIVGSRKLSEYGRQATSLFAEELSFAGFTIVSGGATGADSEAHKASLRRKGATVAFLGSALDVPYPASNARLFDAIASEGGAVATPFVSWTPPLRHHFPIRNALVAAFSRGTLVTEAAENSGSLITAKFALDFWKETFAVPWDVFRPHSLGTNRLIRDWMAKAALSPADVANEIPLFRQSSIPNGKDSVSTNSAPCPCDPVFEAVLELAECDAETLSRHLGWPIPKTLSRLSMLELDGALVSSSGKYRVERGARQSSFSR